jgi:hypothetical protein
MSRQSAGEWNVFPGHGHLVPADADVCAVVGVLGRSVLWRESRSPDEIRSGYFVCDSGLVLPLFQSHMSGVMQAIATRDLFESYFR